MHKETKMCDYISETIVNRNSLSVTDIEFFRQRLQNSYFKYVQKIKETTFKELKESMIPVI